MIRNRPACAGFALLAALGSHMGVAEEQLTPMVVTASRVEQSTLEAPSNVTVVKKDDLEASGAVRVGDALNVLQFTPQKAAGLIRQVMYSALSNATNNKQHVQAGLDVDGLIVKNVIVSEGPSWKRFLPRAQGRATQIIKRTSHITVILAEN